MCGIFGWHLPEGKVLNRDQRAILGTLLAVGNDNRGGDSWGFYNFAELVRGIGDIADHVPLTVRNKRLIAHTRKATTGKISVENAHPFDIGNIIGAHNGVVYNHDELIKNMDRKFEVDSMHLFAHINEGRTFDDIRGYGAIHWTEKDDPQKNIKICKLTDSADLAVYGIGTHENPLGLVWSSDERHLTKALKTANIESFPYKIETNKVYRLAPDGVLYSTREKYKFGAFAITTNSNAHYWDGAHYGRQWKGYQGYNNGVSKDPLKVWDKDGKKFVSDGEKTLITNKDTVGAEKKELTGTVPDQNKLEPEVLLNESSGQQLKDSSEGLILMDKEEVIALMELELGHEFDISLDIENTSEEKQRLSVVADTEPTQETSLENGDWGDEKQVSKSVRDDMVWDMLTHSWKNTVS